MSTMSSASVIVVEGLVQFVRMRELFKVGDDRSKDGAYECYARRGP